MTVRAKLFDGSPSDWDAFVEGQPEATFYHQYGWLQLVREVYGGEPFYLAAYDGDSLVGVLPLMRRWVIGPGRVLVSVPFADEGGLLVTSAEAEAALLDAAASLGRDEKVSYVELRQRRPVGPEDLPRDLSRVTLIRPLGDSAEALWSELDRKVRNQVRKARKSELTTREGGRELLQGFYRPYVVNTRDLGSPMHALRFFEGLFERFGSSARAVVVELGGERVGGAILTTRGATASVPWASCERRYFRLCPNNLLYWRCFELAVEAGCQEFDFGRSAPSSGTYRFKKQWGADEHQLHWSYLPIAGRPHEGERREGAAYRIFSRLWRHAPAAVAAAIGPHVLSRIPV